jgi:hypothetical protein
VSRTLRVSSFLSVTTLILAASCLPATASAQSAPQPSLASAAPQPAAKDAPAEEEATDAGKTDKAEGAGNGGAKAPAVKRAGIALPPEKAEALRVTRFEKAPVVDGLLDEEVWKTAAVMRDFYQTRPGDNTAPSQPTEVLVGYDEKTFYVAFRAHDEAGKVRATVAKRDSVFDDDWVGITLDTFNDQRRAYTFIFNPLGVQADAVHTEGRGEDYSVDVVMESKGVVTDKGYTVEVAIPFKSLRYEAGKGKFWGVNAIRSIKRLNDERHSWMPLVRGSASILNQYGRLTGLEGVSTERTIEIIPSLTLSETGKRVRSIPPAVLRSTPGLVDHGRFVNQPIALEPGLTAKFGLTPTVTLDMAFNPDFAQVEADQLVVTANQRFPLFFSEKRPFFLEGIEIFQTPLTAVHTRAIVDPDVAVKLSGKRGKDSFGVMLASDAAPGNFVGDERLDPRNERFLDKNAYVGVIRLKRDVGAQSNVGLIATTYNFIERHNHTGGFDGRFQLDSLTTFTFQALGTTSRRNFFDPERGRSSYRTGNGFGYSWVYDRTGRNFGYQFSGSGRTRDYRADVGFTPRTNTNRVSSFFRYNTDPDAKRRLTNWRVSNFFGASFDWQGRSQNWTEEAQLQLNFPRQSFIAFGYNGGYERVLEEEFGARRTAANPCDPTGAGGALRPCTFFGPDPERSAYRREFFAYGGTTPSKKYSVFAFVNYRRGALDYDFGGGRKFPRASAAAVANPHAPLDPGPGRMFVMDASLRYQPTAALSTSLAYNKSRLVRDDTGLVAFDENIISSRTTYQFTRFLFARARVDYSTLSARVRGQFLAGWTPNPGTSFYVGYNDDLNHNGFWPASGLREPGLRRNERTFFVKMSYLFRRSI